MVTDIELLLDVLNSAPLVDGETSDGLVGDVGAERARGLGGEGSEAELAVLRRMRDALQDLVRGHSASVREVQSLLEAVQMSPEVTVDGIRWRVDAPPAHLLAARTAQAWSDVTAQFPGRLRACANEECNLYLLDRTRPGTAKWCSMATCGNRMKARAYAARQRASENTH